MNISISGHHISITDAIEASVLDKLEKIERHFDKIISLQVILSLDNHHSEVSHGGKNNNKAEAILRIPGKEIYANATDDDMYHAIHLMAERLDKQVRRYKSKLKSHSMAQRYHHNAIPVQEPTLEQSKIA